MEEFFPPQIADKQKAAVSRIFETGEPMVALEAPNYTTRGLRWYNTTLTPIRDADGKTINVVGYARDVTDIKQAGQALKKFQQVQKDIIQDGPIGILFGEATGEITVFNKIISRITGYAHQEIPRRKNLV